mmetsp:Transcript_394/g.1288  ORF Transcript_394/g.1288 Transcript_394/m.1288 type:complete len:232 (-) Transcript_394:530-1225(-)
MSPFLRPCWVKDSSNMATGETPGMPPASSSTAAHSASWRLKLRISDTSLRAGVMSGARARARTTSAARATERSTRSRERLLMRSDATSSTRPRVFWSWRSCATASGVAASSSAGSSSSTRPWKSVEALSLTAYASAASETSKRRFQGRRNRDLASPKVSCDRYMSFWNSFSLSLTSSLSSSIRCRKMRRPSSRCAWAAFSSLSPRDAIKSRSACASQPWSGSSPRGRMLPR